MKGSCHRRPIRKISKNNDTQCDRWKNSGCGTGTRMGMNINISLGFGPCLFSCSFLFFLLLLSFSLLSLTLFVLHIWWAGPVAQVLGCREWTITLIRKKRVFFSLRSTRVRYGEWNPRSSTWLDFLALTHSTFWQKYPSGRCSLCVALVGWPSRTNFTTSTAHQTSWIGRTGRAETRGWPGTNMGSTLNHHPIHRFLRYFKENKRKQSQSQKKTKASGTSGSDSGEAGAPLKTKRKEKQILPASEPMILGCLVLKLPRWHVIRSI